MEWKVPGDEFVPCPHKGFMVSFVAFHECGFSVPPGGSSAEFSSSTDSSCNI
jgi:hypothetical protein